MIGRGNQITVSIDKIVDCIDKAVYFMFLSTQSVGSEYIPHVSLRH